MQIAPTVARAGEPSSQLLDLRPEGGPPVLQALHLLEEGDVAGRGIRGQSLPRRGRFGVRPTPLVPSGSMGSN